MCKSHSEYILVYLNSKKNCACMLPFHPNNYTNTRQPHLLKAWHISNVLFPQKPQIHFSLSWEAPSYHKLNIWRKALPTLNKLLITCGIIRPATHGLFSITQSCNLLSCSPIRKKHHSHSPEQGNRFKIELPHKF